ncbi:MAG: transcriptional repressor [Dethiobacter sp.]|nr:transcriptional repressor [Dethiobacter sp.]
MTSNPRSHRMTKQRRVILDVLRDTDSHPTADWLYEQVRRIVPRISLGTVYRNLRVLKEKGDIQELNYGSTYSRFDGKTENHYHFVCLECARIGDVLLPLSEDIDKKVTDSLGWQVDFHRLEFYGSCPDCTAKEKAQ